MPDAISPASPGATNTDAKTLQGFVGDQAMEGATVYTDDHGGYHGMPFEHETVKHSVSEYVNGMAHTNGIESFWARLKRGYHSTYHHMSEKHLNRYVGEFAGRHKPPVVYDSEPLQHARKAVSVLYAVISFSDGAELPANAQNAAKHIFDLYAPRAWFMEFNGTSYELTDLIWPDGKEESSPAGKGLVLLIENQNGYASTSLWEWLKTRSK